MINIEEFEKLKPNFDNNTYELEPFENFYLSYKKYLPNFPKCVLEQWTHRHFNGFCYDYWWIEFDRLVFEKVKFTNKMIMQIGTHMLSTLDNWGDDFINNPNFRIKKTWLGGYMYENKTFPKPIIVFDVENSIDFGGKKDLYKPFHLLEGHMRLAYMRALIRYNVDNIPEIHDIWLSKRI